MRPFNQAPITDRSRELFGTYMRRYETPPSMSAFDAPISDRRRELYGEYRSRWSSRKVGRLALTNAEDANGTNWVDMTWFDPMHTGFDIAMYRYSGHIGGAWAGVPHFRLLIDDQKVYPFGADVVVSHGIIVSFGTLSTAVRQGETAKLQFKSSNAADGAGETLSMAIYYATFE